MSRNGIALTTTACTNRTIRRIFMSALAATLAGPAMAADLSPVALPAKVAAYAPAFSWSGHYFGVNIG